MSKTLYHEFKDAIEKMKDTPQRKDYHPEVWVWNHEAYVYFNLLKNCEEFFGSKKEELLLTSFFHDIGKIDTTFYREDKECYVAYGHENASLTYYDCIKDLVVPEDCRIEVIRFLIEQHMKAKFLHDMNESTIEDLKEEAKSLGDEVWEMLLYFSEFDNMNNFFQNTEEEERVEAKYRFHSYVSDLLNKVDTYCTGEDYQGDLLLVRGVSGSGKTTLANTIEKNSESVYKIAADNFFLDENGEYKFDGSKLGEAHRFCRNKTREAIDEEYDLILVHNTFVEKWEMMKYFKIAADENYRVHTVVTENRHNSSSIHDISSSKIEEKKDKFEIKL